MQNDVIVDPVRQEVLMIQPLSYLIMDKKKHFDFKKVKSRVNHTDFKVIIDTG